MKERRVLFLTYGSVNHASSRIRAIQYFQLLEKDGISPKLICHIPERRTLLQKILFPLKKRFNVIRRSVLLLTGRFPLIFIQREFIHPFLLRVLRKKETSLIYDFDDAIYLNTPGHRKNGEKFSRMIRAANHVIASSPVLAKYCESIGVEAKIITTPIDFDEIEKKENYDFKDSFTIGWTGSASTTKFLELVKDALKNVSEKTDIRLILIGSKKDFNIPGIEIKKYDWSEKTERRLIKDFDAGIMPLPETDFAKGKGGYKLFLYMAAGVPVITSPVGINREIVQDGLNGLYATDTEDWERQILKLAGDKQLRERIGKSGMNAAKEKYDRSYCYSELKDIIIKRLK